MKVYKVVRVIYVPLLDEKLISAYVENPACVVEYAIGKITKPQKGKGHLAAFRSLALAKNFQSILGYPDLYYKTAIYAAIATPGRKPRFPRKLVWYPNTQFCRTIRLTRLIA